jgi:sirohydrochlorin cobaltochelatase
MEQMAKDGIEDILVQPTHILNGTENDRMIADIAQRDNDFQRIAIGEPLLYATKDYFDTIHALTKTYPLPKDTALVMMGHGTEHYTNSAYAALDYMMKDRGLNHYFVGTVEGYPDFEAMLRLLQKSPYKKVQLIPLMIVAGDHANNDMVGEDDDSWKNLLEKAGYEVSYVLKGLGEIKEIRDIFICHAQKEETRHA